MKKLGVFLLAAAAALAMSGCVVSEESSQVITDNDPAGESQAETSAAPEGDTKASVGQTVTSDTWAISLTGAKVYEEIAGEYLTDKPEEGKVYLVLFFDVQNVSEEDDYFNYLNVESYVDGYSATQSLLTSDPDGYEWLTGDVAAGKKLQGYMAWEVDPEWKELEVSYKDDLWTGNKAATFVVTPDDLTA
ncbi:MAG TPA: DUF5067 domain-containing protein [Firmicutes bacterium]|nr:DUF5067 domain-containing protein [Bacillota bacterium]